MKSSLIIFSAKETSPSLKTRSLNSRHEAMFCSGVVMSHPSLPDGRVSTVRHGLRTRNAGPPSALTLRTEVAGPLLDLDGLDRGPAPPAGQSLPAVDLELVLVLARLAEQIQVRLVLERGAARLDRVLEDLLDRAVEPSNLLGRERVAHPVVSDPRREQDLVRVDVAQAADELLVHHQLLHLRGALCEQVLERGPREDLIQRVDRDVLELLHLAELVGRRHEHLSEGPGIHESQIPALLERDDHVRVWCKRDASVRPREPTT